MGSNAWAAIGEKIPMASSDVPIIFELPASMQYYAWIIG